MLSSTVQVRSLPQYHTWFLPRPASKESNVPKLKSSKELTVLIFIMCLMPCNPIVIASCWDYLCFLLNFPFTNPFLGHKVYWNIKVLFAKALINQEEPRVCCEADKMVVFFSAVCLQDALTDHRRSKQQYKLNGPAKFNIW